MKDHTHKLIFVIHPSFLDRYTRDLPPIPVLNEAETFDPVKEWMIQLKKIKQSFEGDFMSLVNG